jgi:hypothetical protein
MRIDKKVMAGCDLCKVDRPQVPNPAYNGDEGCSESPTMTDPNWNGLPAYSVFAEDREDSDYWHTIVVCESCMDKLVRSVNLIKTQKLKSVKL